MHYFKQLILILIISILGIAVLVHHVYANGVPGITAGQSGTPRMDFVDVSSWNGRLTTADFDKMKQHGVKGVVVKLTEGTYYVNPSARAQIASAQAAGLRIAVYHYSKYQTPASAVSEADYFTKQVKNYQLPNHTVLVDDLEDVATRQGNVTQNVRSFRDRLAANGYPRYMLYTSPSYIAETQLKPYQFGLRNIWMASYPYQPTANNLWHTQYGAWQWNSKTSFPGVVGLFGVSVDYGSPILQQGTSVTTNSKQTVNNIFYSSGKPAKGYLNDGTGWYWFEGGKRYTGFRYYKGTYYWFNKGVRQGNQWQTAWGKRYYVGADGRAVQGIRQIGEYKYYFGNNGTHFLRTNQQVKLGKQTYYANAQGQLTPWQGYIQFNRGWQWFEKGLPYTGFRFYMGTYYWFTHGFRQHNQWQTAWGYRYYVGADGRAVQGHQKINNRDYYFGNDGTFYLR